MNDAELKKYWATIKEPVDMLKALVENSMYIGTDPYYRDLNDALIENAERVLREQNVAFDAT